MTFRAWSDRMDGRVLRVFEKLPPVPLWFLVLQLLVCIVFTIAIVIKSLI
jgi:hypothetical protein